MKPQVFSTGLGEQYHLLGAAFNRGDVWLVRHAGSQELFLLQRFSRPCPALAQLLATNAPHLPAITDSWMDSGSIYVVMERVSGTGLEELSRNVMSGQAQAQLNHLQQLLQRLGFQACTTDSLCLSPSGTLRMRYFPRTLVSRSQAA